MYVCFGSLTIEKEKKKKREENIYIYMYVYIHNKNVTRIENKTSKAIVQKEKKKRKIHKKKVIGNNRKFIQIFCLTSKDHSDHISEERKRNTKHLSPPKNTTQYTTGRKRKIISAEDYFPVRTPFFYFLLLLLIVNG